MATANPAPLPPGPVSGTDTAVSGLGRAIELTLRLATSWWGLLTAYAGGITLAVVAFQKLEEPLKGSPAWLRALIVAAPLVLALVFHVIPTLVEQRRRRRLAEITGEMKAGYFSLAPREDEEGFTRADGKHQEILRWLEKSSAPVLYLTGLSGSGKSSLLGAFVLPQLQRQDTVAIRLRGYQDPLTQLEQELLKPEVIWQKPANESGEIRLLLERASRYIRPRRLLIVLDQFEEFVILQNPAQQERLQQLFSSFTQAPIEGLTFLLVFRSDYIGLIEDLKLPLLVQDANWKEVPPFTESAARTFMQGSGIKVDETLVRDVLREAAEIEQAKGLVRPITINLCGLVLGRFASGLPRGFRPGGLIRGFLRESLTIPAVRDVTPKLVPCLITNYVTKRPRTIPQLAAETGLKPGEVRGCLRVLGQSDRAVVRALDSEQQTWEISHDFLVPLLDSIVARRTVSLWKRFRSWLPWIAATCLVLCLAIVPNLRRDPTDALRKLGWTVTWDASGVTVQAKSIPHGNTLHLLKNVHDSVTLRLEEIDFRISEWQILRNLKTLDLSERQVNDLKPLAKLTSLTTLNLSSSQVRNVEPLSKLTELTTLYLSDTDVSDVGPLQALTSLSTLDLSSTSISDLRPLGVLRKLTRLKLSAKPVSNAEPLGELIELTDLDLSKTSISDAGPLKTLAKLTTLDLSSTQVRNVKPLSKLTELTDLDLSGTSISDAGPIRALRNLSHLDLRRTQVSNVEPLGELMELTNLELSNTSISDVGPLKTLAKLTSLDLSSTQVRNVEPLSKLTELTTLYLSDTKVSDVGPLKTLARLTTLDLSSTQVKNVEPLGALAKLTLLNLRFTTVSDADLNELRKALPNAQILK